MIKKFTQFWIENTKVTIVLLIVTIITGIGSYILIPKQYNPDIPVPAYNIIVPAPWFSAKEVEHLVVEPLQDKIYETKDIDHIYGVAHDDFWVVTVRYKVWSDKEKATTRLYNKIFENMGQKPIWVKEPIIKKMDSDDFPVYTFGIVNTKNNDPIQLRKTAKTIANKLKFVDGVSEFYLVWWYKDNIQVELDMDKLKAKHIDIMQVYNAIEKDNLVFPWWDLKLDKTSSSIIINWNINSIEKLNKLIVWNYRWKSVYLQEVATIFKWVWEKNYYSFITNKKFDLKDAVFIWVARAKWVNQVTLVDDLKKKLDEVKKSLPDGYKIVDVDNEWKVARESTNALLINLAESVLIVFLVLWLYLWFKDAINNSFAIPLVLFMVFLIAFVVWDNINRIVLFALVLALWMLVDNSTVIIENIAKHIKEKKDWESVKDAILKAVDEVWVWVILATITRILALVAMFFVTWMMGEYMWWVPKYVIISLIVSLFVAFSINPFLAYYFHKNTNKKDNKIDSKPTKKSALVRWYEWFLAFFLWDNHKWRRRFFKLTFWLSLFAVLILPPLFWVFKMGMLPKDDKNQIYIWIDGKDNWSVKKSKEVAEYTDKLLNQYYYDNWDKKHKNLDIVKNTSYWIWVAPIVDFANAFRWVSFRSQQNQISLRVNLIDKEKRKMSSIDFTMKMRDILKKQIWEKYPDAKIRLLEDPAWPPTRAAFMLKVQWDRSAKYSDLENLSDFIKEKINPLLKKDDVVDVYTTKDTYRTNYKVDIDHQLLSKYWLTTQQVAYTIYNIFKWSDVSLVHDKHTKEPINIHLTVKENQKYTQDIFNQITFMNQKWQKIYLNQFAKLVPWEQDHTIYTEDKYKTVYIYGEMWDNSVVYPAFHITVAMMQDKFWQGNFKVIGKNPYWVTIKSKETWQTYHINWWWERKLSLDTFRDLWIAMIIALLSIYFLMVAQFKSFKIAWVIMITFLIWFFGIMPWFSLVHELLWVWFVSPSMIWVIALAWIVVWNAIILIEYLNLLLRQWYNKKLALIKAWSTRMRAIIITSLTTVLGSLTILSDPVWWGLGRSIVWWLSVSAVLTLIVIPIFLYDVIEYDENTYKYKVDETIELEKA